MNIPRPQSKQTVPDSAKLVFKGKIFSVYQWEQIGYDGSVHIFEKLKRSDTVVIIPILENGNFIMSKQEQPGKEPFEALIGGRVYDGEGALEGAKRELLEETGYVSDKWELFFSEQPTSKIEWAIFYFIAKDCKKVAEQNLDGAEKVELKEKTWEEFLAAVESPNFSEQELRVKVLEARLYPKKMEELRRKMLGESNN